MALTREEVQLADALLSRVEQLAAAASEKGVRLMIDAEHTYFQPVSTYIPTPLQSTPAYIACTFGACCRVCGNPAYVLLLRSRKNLSPGVFTPHMLCCCQPCTCHPGHRPHHPGAEPAPQPPRPGHLQHLPGLPQGQPHAAVGGHGASTQGGIHLCRQAGGCCWGRRMRAHADRRLGVLPGAVHASLRLQSARFTHVLKACCSS